MSHLKIWRSGWIRYGNGTLHYIPEFSSTEGCGCCGDSGSGCGDSGSGCGESSGNSGSGGGQGNQFSSGDRINSGNSIIGTLKSGAIQITATWGAGNTTGCHDMANLSVAVSSLSCEYIIEGNVTINAEWIGHYEASIAGDFSYTNKGKLRHIYICNGTFSVPEEYHVESTSN
jgi:hypothetical protein